MCLESLPTVTMEEPVHDVVDHNRDSAGTEPPLPEAMKILVEDDVLGRPASVVYHDCLRQLAELIVLPVKECAAKDPVTKRQCSATAPFELHIKSRGTAVVVDWVSWHILEMIYIQVIWQSERFLKFPELFHLNPLFCTWF